MKPVDENQNLPNDAEAQDFVCRCLGIGIDELDRTLARFAKDVQPQSEKQFPGKFWRETVKRAKVEKSRWGRATQALQKEAAYDLIRRQKGHPLWSFTGKLTDELISVLISLYARLRPKLELQGISTKEALWILVGEVFIPTAFIKIVLEWRHGLGNEFLDETCWYLPMESDGEVQKPIPRVLGYWMRVAGIQTSYRAAKLAGESSLRRKIDRWLEGVIVPDPLDLHELVDKFAAEVCWLDEPDTWKARFTLARAMQTAGDLMDEYFKPVKKNSSLALMALLRGVLEDRVACAGDQLLSGAHTFFAARLLQRRLQAEKKWTPDVADQAAWFKETIWKMAVSDGSVGNCCNPLEANVVLEQHLFDLGIFELNRIFEIRSKKGRRGNPRRL